MDRLVAECVVEAGDKLWTHQVQLRGPHRIGAGNRQYAVALSRGTTRGGYLRTDGLLPDLLYPGQWRGGRQCLRQTPKC